MFQSMTDGPIWEKEFALLVDQEHFEKVWGIMLPNVEQYADSFLTSISNFGNQGVMEYAYSAFVQELIEKNDKRSEKYHDIFDLDLFEDEYEMDKDDFKNTTLKKECDVINKTLQSKAEALNEWKKKFYASPSQKIFDTCYNFISFGADYNEEMDEERMSQIETIVDTGLEEMNEAACYQSGVFGFGIVSNILNHMYPRVFPGNYKKGIFSLLFLTGRDMKGISPYVQARKSQYEIFDRIIKHANRTRFTRPMLCYAVWFPSIEFKPNDELPPEAAVEITFDKKSLLNAQSVIEDAYDFWKDKLRVNTRPLSGDDTRCVMDVLCPYFHAVPKLGTTINESEHIYIRLTNQQIALLDFLVEQDTAVIHGLAGTGKTVLAIEKAKMLAAQGESVLFLCYNSFLRDSLRENNTIPGVVFHNAHSLAYEIMGATDSKIDDVLAEFEEYLEVVFDKENWKYKNVIVDEGQDLDDRLLNRLYDLSKSKKGSFYVFYDKNQFIMKKRQPHWLEDAECRLVLSKNCRNTAEIFKTACSIIGKENLTLNEIHGEVPFLRFYSTEKEMTAIVEGFLERMKKGEVPADKITILSASTLDNSFIDAKRKYAGFELSEKREPGKVHFTTIRKFKGLEAEAILVVDASMIGLKSEEDRRLLYVGVSRAKNYLEIAMNQDIADSELGDYLHALNPNRSLPRNKKGLKRLLNVDI